MTEKFSHVPQTVQFRSGANSCGVEMAASSLRAEDSLGANDGSKTTTLVTYLADAWNWGAEIFCECEVRYIKKAKQGDHDGYLVLFAWHGGKRDSATADTYCDLMWVFARKAVFLGAGTFGTAEILLRSKENGLHVSDWVGQNISDNGDYVAFGYVTASNLTIHFRCSYLTRHLDIMSITMCEPLSQGRKTSAIHTAQQQPLSSTFATATKIRSTAT